jgi:hypothetical protein
VAGFFGVGLITLKIVDGGSDFFAGFFAGAYGVEGVADHLESLERDHDFVVFNEVADEHQDFFCWHGLCAFRANHSSNRPVP